MVTSIAETKWLRQVERRYGSVLMERIGNTPLIRLDGVVRRLPEVTLLAKAEWMNPGGSVKDRAAAAMVRSHGYTPNDTSEYHDHQTLRVLVGTRTGSGDGYGQQAFFFVDGRYIGTDTREPSAKLKVVSQTDTQVTIAYPLYRHGDPLCCPGGGQANVRYELNNGKLAPVGTIPPVSSTSGLSRG